MKGKVIQTRTYDLADGTNRFSLSDLDNLASGMYFLRFDNKRMKQRFIIKVQKK